MLVLRKIGRHRNNARQKNIVNALLNKLQYVTVCNLDRKAHLRCNGLHTLADYPLICLSGMHYLKTKRLEKSAEHRQKLHTHQRHRNTNSLFTALQSPALKRPAA
ncbi:hypothetical protein ES703_122548 [subsurface metagenome]